MKKIEEKVAISGDGAELIQSYLNELNMKLLAAGITESYSIVMEAETLFISEINELNKKTKVTVYEVQKIIEKHGTPDEIVQRYKQASEAQMDEEFYSMDFGARELIKRSTNLNSDLKKLKNASFHGLGLITLILPPILLTLALIHLNQYEGNFIVFVTFLEIVKISDDRAITFIILGSILFSVQEITTGLRGKLFISLRNTIRLRTYNRSIIFTGALASFWLTRIPREYVFNPFTRKRDIEVDLPYTESILTAWIVLFIITEIIIFARDHLSTLYPLQPRFTPYQRFLKIHYILVILAIIILTIFTGDPSRNTLIIAMSLGVVATLLTYSKNYNPGPRFYFSIQLIPMMGLLNQSIARYFMYGEAILILIIILIKYRKEIKTKTKHILDVVS
ncbi:MAG: hypothetical protein GPJ54_18780 [Candidatus Heimdallarchaeota archaeon]|nr:hypothetical protein [Candidatus Heimdallarchaeota archaeon]